MNTKRLFVFMPLLFCALAFGKTEPLAGSEYPAMCSGPLTNAIVKELKPGVAATCGDLVIKDSDISAEITKAPAYVKAQFENYPIFVLEKLLLTKMLSRSAQEWATKNKKGEFADYDTLITSYLNAITPEPVVTDEEAEQFYNQNKAMFNNEPFPQLKEIIINYLKGEKRSDYQTKYINDISVRNKVFISNQWLNTAWEKWLNNNPIEVMRKSGKTSIAVFTNVGCCDKMSPVFEKIAKDMGEQVNTLIFNIGKEQALSYLYRVKVSPLILIYDKSGRLVTQSSVNMTEDQLKAVLAKINE